MFNALEKVAVATIGTTGLFIAAAKLQALPAYFMAPMPSGMMSAGDAQQAKVMQLDASQQRVNSFAAGILTGGIAAGVVLAFWKR